MLIKVVRGIRINQLLFIVLGWVQWVVKKLQIVIKIRIHLMTIIEHIHEIKIPVSSESIPKWYSLYWINAIQILLIPPYQLYNTHVYILNEKQHCGIPLTTWSNHVCGTRSDLLYHRQIIKGIFRLTFFFCSTLFWDNRV